MFSKKLFLHFLLQLAFCIIPLIRLCEGNVALQNGKGYMDFHDVAKQILSEECDELSAFTRRSYFFCLQKLQHFSPKLQIENVTPQFVKDYRQYLIEKGNKPATVSKALSVLRNFQHRMKQKGFTSQNPFADIKIKRVQGNRQYLNTHDLSKLYERFITHKDMLRIPERNAVQAFLFGCFTGLRYQDLKSLTFEEIHEGHIRKQMHKTGDYVYIPITEQAKNLIRMSSQKDPASKCLNVSENSYFNKFLRSGAERLGITQHLHCHLARHTFATTCLTLDIPLAVTSKLLGHRDVSTTLIYAKYVDKILDKEMKKFKRLK